MELSRLTILLRRWAWLLVVGLVLGMLVGFFISKVATPIYQASTKLLISPAPQVDNVDLSILDTSELIDTYIEFQKARSILDEVSQQLDYELDPKQIQVEQVQNAQLIEIKVEDSDAEISAAIANRLVEVLVEGPSKFSRRDDQATDPITQMTGRTPCDRIVVFEGNRRLAGQLLPVTIYEVSSHTLFGQVVTECVGPDVHSLQLS